MSIPRPEYPRPQLVRESWLNLNGPWQFEFDPGSSGLERGLLQAERLAQEIIVPFCPESELSGLGCTDFHSSVWYRRTVTLPEEWAGERILLHFGAVDYDTIVWVNGCEVGRHRGGYTPFFCEITDQLHDGENVIVVNAQDDTRSPLIPSGKQSTRYDSYSCFYTRTTGIWQTVWLEPVPQTYIENLSITPNLETGQVMIEAALGGTPICGTISITASLDGRVAGTGHVAFSGRHAMITLDLKEVSPWEPGAPVLYDLDLLLAASDGSRDGVQSYFGLRSLDWTDNVLMFNGQPLYQRLVLDQGFYPDGIYTAPSDEALRRDIEIGLSLGFNGARLHEKVFEPRFLYWADKLGYLVWGEFPNWGLDVSDPQALEVFIPQWLEAVRRDYSHPALVGWCPFNETPREQDGEILRSVYLLTKAADSTRPVIDTSGYVHVQTDVYDVHDYTQDPDAFKALFQPFAEGGDAFLKRPGFDAPYAGQPYFVSEYGGIWWNPKEAQDMAAWGYGGVDARPRTVEEFLARYKAMTEYLLNHPRMCAFCYTQLYDIDLEVNGLYTYDRQPKFDDAKIREINEQPAAIER